MNTVTYTEIGGYLIPDLTIPAQMTPLGTFGRMRRNYLKEHRGSLYTKYTLEGTLFPHCLEIEQTANQQLEQMMTELEAQHPPPDKATDPMAWVAHMNGLKLQAEEVIVRELIYS